MLVLGLVFGLVLGLGLRKRDKRGRGGGARNWVFQIRMSLDNTTTRQHKATHDNSRQDKTRQDQIFVLEKVDLKNPVEVRVKVPFCTQLGLSLWKIQHSST